MNQKEFWNRKFSNETFLYGKNANVFIKSYCANFLKNQKVLCVGEGEGRNAMYLAKIGFEVCALDASDVGLNKLKTWAKKEEMHVSTICTDILSWNTEEKYGTILASFFHIEDKDKTAVFTNLEECLETKGFLVLEVFSKNQINYSSGGPKDISLLYDVNSFKTIFKHSTIYKLEEVLTHLDEGNGHQGKASVIRLILQKN